MGGRLKPLSKEQHDQVQAELAVLAERASKLGNIVGPAYGAAWCDKALKLNRLLLAFGSQIDDEFFRNGGGR